MEANETYSKRSIWIHWLSALLLFITIPTGLAMSETEASDTKLLLYQIHILIGISVFILAIFHIYVYFKDQRPQSNDTGSRFRNTFISILHKILTILIIVLTITGIGSLFTTEIFKAISEDNYKLLSVSYDSILINIHHIQGIIYIALIVLHIAGVILHRIMKKKHVLKRMGLNI